MVNKIIDWFANLARSLVNKTTDIKYENLINSADFRSLYARYGYKNEEEWISKARESIVDISSISKLVVETDSETG